MNVGGLLSLGLLCHAHKHAESVGDLSTALARGVLISERRRVRPVTEDLHQLGHRGALDSPPGCCARATQVVEVQPARPSSLARLRPPWPELRPPKR